MFLSVALNPRLFNRFIFYNDVIYRITYGESHTMDQSDKASKKMQPLPIGVDDYKDLIDEGYVYVDKTLFIKDFWDYKSKVTLITRPRRFGKSITLSMLRYFFEKKDLQNSKEPIP